MARIIADAHYDIGGYREVYEDRVMAKAVITAGGLRLTVASVADGVGGENNGERAAQTALDTLFNYLQKSRELNVSALLSQAVQYANKAVYRLQRETGGASTTLTVAVVDENTCKLYVANVGDSRIYLCRNQKLTQLTLDHSFANIMPWRGQISVEAARNHPKAHMLMRAIGPREPVEVDLGFYVGTTDYAEANRRGRDGLPLQDGDAVLVCSDGLVKDAPHNGHPLITTDEIVRTLHDKEGKKAAQELVSFALGRGPDDNISAALIQMPDRWRAWRARRPVLLAGAAILSLMVVLSLVTLALAGKQDQLGESTATVAALAQAQQTAEAISSYTPTPTITPTPTATLPPLLPDEVGFIQNEGRAFKVNDELYASEPNMQLFVYHTANWQPPGYIFAFPGSLLSFDEANKEGVEFTLSPNSQVFIETGHYPRVEVRLTDGVSISVEGRNACMAVDFQPSPAQIVFGCYEGQQCSYNILGGPKGTFLPGYQVILDPQANPVADPRTIPSDEAKAYSAMLPAGTARQCTSKYVPTPMPTFTPQPTLTLAPNNPTSTPAPSDTPLTPSATTCGSQQQLRLFVGLDTPRLTDTSVTPEPPADTSTPTNTPGSSIKPPTKTSTPTNIPTIAPIPTNTPIVPTHTPTPTNTPMIPTKTATPTNTAIPTETPTEPPTNTPCP
jgi:PPM family protein phosphatase